MSSDRRGFLKKSAALAGAITYGDLIKLAHIVAAGTSVKALAQVGEVSVKNYIRIHASGGAPRWFFDQWLTPNPTDELLTTENFATWQEGASTGFDFSVPGGKAIHKIYTYRGVQVPHHYQYPVLGSVGNRLASELLDNMAVIRGVNSQVDGHEVNAPIQNFPDPAVPTLDGIVADARKDLIAAVNMGTGPTKFFSASGKTLSVTNDIRGTSGAIGGLLKPFKKYNPSSSVISNMDQVTPIRKYFNDLMKSKSAQFNTSASALDDHTRNAKSLIDFAAEDLVSVWNSLYNKYKTIMNGSAQCVPGGAAGAIPGLTDQKVTLSAGRTLKNFTWNNSVQKLTAGSWLTGDYPTAWANSAGDIDPDWDLREMLNTPGLSVDDELIRGFALAEYCITRNISGNISLNYGGIMGNMNYLLKGTSTLSSRGIPNDCHFDSIRATQLPQLAQARGLIAGLLELISVLKATERNGKNLFDQTIIHMTGDFTRDPKNNGASLDHGYMAQVSSIISGVVKQPTIVGNISKYGSYYSTGTWGHSAVVDFNGSKETLSPRHVAAAIINAMGLPNPWSFTHLVWKLENGVIVPKIGAKVV